MLHGVGGPDSRRGREAVLHRVHGVALAGPVPLPSLRATTADPQPWDLVLEAGPSGPPRRRRDLESVAGQWRIEGALPVPDAVELRLEDPTDGASLLMRAEPASRRVGVRWSVDDEGALERVTHLLSSRLVPFLACVERGAVALHAAAAAVETGALVCCGPSGAGKSTVVAALLCAGAVLHGDEPVLLDLAGGRVQSWPGVGMLRVDEGSIGARALAARGWTTRAAWDKDLWDPPAPLAADSPVPVAAVLLLGERLAPGEPVGLRELAAIEALPALMGQAYPIAMHGLREQLPVFSELAQQTTALEVRVPELGAGDDLADLGRAILARVESLT